MKTPFLSWGWLALVAGAALYGVFAVDPRRLGEEAPAWTGAHAALLGDLTVRYGPPDRLDRRCAMWSGAGPWVRIVLVNETGVDPLTQTVSYVLTPEQLEMLSELPGGLSGDPVRAELTSSAWEERLNVLALNVADEVLTARSTPAVARARFERIARLAASGKRSRYTERLLFEPPPAPPRPAPPPGLWMFLSPLKSTQSA